jgi:antitoxin YefM
MKDALPELRLLARIGVNTGEMVTGTEERLATGDAVNVAARLAQAAHPGEILLGQETWRLVRDAVDVEAIEPLVLKGESGDRAWPGRGAKRTKSCTIGIMARTVPFSQARSELTALVDDVERLHEHVVLTRNGRPSVVVMSMAEYEALQETLEVLADSEALDDLRASERDVVQGRVADWEDVKRRRRRA